MSMKTEEFKILYVEDNYGDALLLKTAFKRRKFFPQLDVVEDGIAAMGYLRGEPGAEGQRPDLILLDLNLPKMNGFEILREVREDPTLKQIPVVIFSGSANPNDKATCLASGAEEFFEKPRDIEGFGELIEHLQSRIARAEPVAGR
jgi:CheY-like chemotaxis protein